MRTVIGIRTHKWGNEEEILYKRLSSYFPESNIYVIFDELSQSVACPVGIQKLSITKKLLQELEVYSENPIVMQGVKRQLMWLCGDYFYYCFAHFVKADFYWLVEPDVYFSYNKLSDFFDCYANRTDDGLLSSFRKINSDAWVWKKSLEVYGYNNIYGCFFPISRLSYQAISHCLVERKEISCFFVDNYEKLFPLRFSFPNDEVLVATSLVKNNLSVSSLPSMFYFTYNVFISNSIVETLPKNQLMHPVRDIVAIARYITPKLSVNNNLMQRLDRVYIGNEDIDDLSTVFPEELSDIIRVRANVCELFNLIYHYLNGRVVSCSLSSSKYKLWIWQRNTVVLDLFTPTCTYTLEFTISQLDISGFAFLRKGKDDEFVEKLQHYLKDKFTLNGQKILLLPKQKVNDTTTFVIEIKSIIDYFLKIVLH